MINEQYAHKFCKDDIAKIENYELAKNDTTQTWHCHHRLELTMDYEFAHTAKELIRLGMYYHRPYFELIFLTPSEHHRLHNIGKNNPMYGKPGTMYGKTPSEETRTKISAALKGKNLGKTRSAEARQKISEARKAYLAQRRQEKEHE